MGYVLLFSDRIKDFADEGTEPQRWKVIWEKFKGCLVKEALNVFLIVSEGRRKAYMSRC